MLYRKTAREPKAPEGVISGQGRKSKRYPAITNWAGPIQEKP